VECNKATLDLHGYSSKDEVIGKSAFKLIAKKDQEKAKKNMEIALKEGQIKKVYFTFLKKDGSEFNAELSASPIYDTSGNMTGFVAITQDITVQEKTKLETKRFVKAIETAREATSITSGDGVIIYTNRAMDELFGYKEGELVGKYPSILNAGPRPELVTAQIMNQIKEEGYWEGEIYNKKKNGTEFLSYARISSLKDKDGNIINFLSTQHDITERKQMEEDLRKSKEKYQMLYDSSKDGIIYTDIDGNILDANQAYIDMIGYTIEELRKLTYQKLTPSEWYKTEMEIVRNQVKRRGYSEEYEKEYIRKNGSVFPISIRVWLINDDQGTPLGMWGLVRDITERKQMEEAIKASEEKYRSLAENAMDAIYLISTRNGFEYINPAFERIFGYKAGEIYNKDFRFLDLVYPADRKLIEQRKEAREKGEKLPLVYGFRVITKEGDMKHVEVNTIVLPGKENNVLGILRDVTEKKKIEIRLEESERELRKQKSALEQKNVALREVIAQVELEKRKMKDDIEANFSIVLNPILEKFKNLKVIKPYVNLLQHYIEGLTSSYGILIKKKGVSLTSREMEICNLIKGGLSSKEISKLLNISYRTIEKHRDNIRHKLGISNKKINLTTFLREL
jgi:PAS domain S-box-containing protein